MRKIIITPEQKVALDKYKELQYNMMSFVKGKGKYKFDFKSLNSFTYDEMARLVYQPNSYEVKETYKEGDVLYNKIDKNIFRLSKHESSEINDPKVKHIRKATEEEVKTYKTNKFWSTNDRKVWELRSDDIVKNNKTKRTGIVVVSPFLKSTVTPIEDFNLDEASPIYYSQEDLRSDFEVVCFAQDRKDINGYK